MHLLFLVLVVLLACAGSVRAEDPLRASVNGLSALPPPDPADMRPEAMRKVRLGARLFRDTVLSGDGTIACVTCHDVRTNGADAGPVSTGIGGSLGRRNAPSVFNAALETSLFWDGRAETLEQQAAMVIQNPEEMGGSWPQIVQALSADSGYRTAFAALYPQGIAADSVTDAIAAYERWLVPRNSRFDQWMEGRDDALDDEERTGLRLFVVYGCAACHQGAGLGGNLFQKIGLVRPSPLNLARNADSGRYAVTGRPQDMFVFRVPSLRNVAMTPPYLHNGSAPDLDQVVRLMARHQLGRELDNAEAAALVAFLRTLTGEAQPLP